MFFRKAPVLNYVALYFESHHLQTCGFALFCSVTYRVLQLPIVYFPFIC
jgi:hypothetical protein